MNLIQCQNGHFYDNERFSQCPHCAAGATPSGDMTVPVVNTASDVVTVPLSSADLTVAQNPNTSSLGEALKSAIAKSDDDDERTVGFYKKSMGTDPVVGWLVGISGAHFGEDFRLKSGRNFIGRGADMDVVIAKDSAVSREKHAVVVYEPKGHVFLVMPGESKELCYLNNEVVLSPAPLKVNDFLTVGETTLMFVPCCGPTFNWDAAKKLEEEDK